MKTSRNERVALYQFVAFLNNLIIGDVLSDAVLFHHLAKSGQNQGRIDRLIIKYRTLYLVSLRSVKIQEFKKANKYNKSITEMVLTYMWIWTTIRRQFDCLSDPAILEKGE
jgi:hypothetical protein